MRPHGEWARPGVACQGWLEMDSESARRLLGVPPGASRQDVEQAFRALAKTQHPDRGGDADRFAALLAARKLLLNSDRSRPHSVIGVRRSERWIRQLRRLLTRRRHRRVN